MKNIKHFAGMAGNPSFFGKEIHQAHTDEQMKELSRVGVDTLFVNIAWSRPWLDVVTMEEMAFSSSYPLLSADNALSNRSEFARRIEMAQKYKMKTMGLFGMPKYIDFSKYPESYKEDLMGATQSTICPDQDVCVKKPGTYVLYEELIADILTKSDDPEKADVSALDGMLVYTFDELAEVCAIDSDCPFCRGIALEERIAEFLNRIYAITQKYKKGFEMWWEPWEIAEAQVYTISKLLDPNIKISVHTTINEVYLAGVPDRFVRMMAKMAKEQGRSLIVEQFLSGCGEDIGPVAGFPCPECTLDGLFAIDSLEGDISIKEYYGLCVEYFSVNEAALELFTKTPDADMEQILGELARRYARDESDAASLRKFWHDCSMAISLAPWDISWVYRFSNYTPMYSSHWNKVNFKSLMCTPWSTPSWLSSRRSFYHIVENSNLYNEMLYEDVRDRQLMSLERAETALAALKNIRVKAQYDGEFVMWRNAISLFCVCVRRWLHLQELSHDALILRDEATGKPEKNSLLLRMKEFLKAEATNIAELKKYVLSDETKCYMLSDAETLDRTAAEIEEMTALPDAELEKRFAGLWATIK